MREIKFRAWRDKTKTMTHPAKLYDLMTKYGQMNKQGLEWMQFTGLYDLNGVEIYEGDILTDGHFKWCVVFTDGAFWARRENIVTNIIELQRKRQVAMKIDCINVVGNIHQNPELLK